MALEKVGRALVWGLLSANAFDVFRGFRTESIDALARSISSSEAKAVNATLAKLLWEHNEAKQEAWKRLVPQLAHRHQQDYLRQDELIRGLFLATVTTF